MNSFWDEPDERQIAALVLARQRCNPKRGTDLDAARAICMSREMLGYSILRGWASGKSLPEHVAQESLPILQEAARTMLQIVDLDYHPKHGWWHMPLLGWEPTQLAVKLTMIYDLAGIVLELEKRQYLFGGWLFIAFDIILGKGWNDGVKLMRQDPLAFAEGMIAAASKSLDPVQPCIHPDCDKPVDRRKRKSGACCRAHMNYICTHPDCLKKAEEKGWGKYTHRWNTKIGQQHAEYAARGGDHSPP